MTGKGPGTGQPRSDMIIRSIRTAFPPDIGIRMSVSDLAKGRGEVDAIGELFAEKVWTEVDMGALENDWQIGHFLSNEGAWQFLPALLTLVLRNGVTSDAVATTLAMLDPGDGFGRFALGISSPYQQAVINDFLLWVIASAKGDAETAAVASTLLARGWSILT